MILSSFHVLSIYIIIYIGNGIGGVRSQFFITMGNHLKSSKSWMTMTSWYDTYGVLGYLHF